WKERSIWLPDYRVRIEAQPIEGLNDDVSALTFDPDRRTLFTVTNQPAQIIVNGNKGFEGLAYDAEGKRLFVAKERDPVRIYEIHGFPHTQADKPFAVHVV
ncbi:DNA-binding protein, partial [Escherichia coli]|uniref:SdiA-regulated domain-containing protein n=1 Tax=Escherichia coli TaxID=562 RepID=UPI000FEE38D3